MRQNKIIGEKIKSIRDSQQLTLEEIAQRSGVDIEQIKRIENNTDFPSLAPLIKIARALGVRLGTFLDDQEALGPVISRKNKTNDETSISVSYNEQQNKKHMSYQSLSPDKSGRHMEPFLVDVNPIEGTDYITSTHEGEEFIYVLEGTIEIIYGKNTYTLAEGDSIYYDSIVPHHVHAAKDSSARILGIIYTPY